MQPPTVKDMFLSSCSNKVLDIFRDPAYPAQHLFKLPPYGRCGRLISLCIKVVSSPSAVKLLHPSNGKCTRARLIRSHNIDPLVQCTHYYRLHPLCYSFKINFSLQLNGNKVSLFVPTKEVMVCAPNQFW